MQRLSRFSEQLGTPSTTPAAAERHDYDLLIKGGTLIDPLAGLEGRHDLAVKDGVIAAVFPGAAPAEVTAAETFDATDLLVTPGLVDLHAHGFQFVEPIGLDFDEQCLSRGTTTVVDAGSSGATHFPGFRKHIVERCRTSEN